MFHIPTPKDASQAMRQAVRYERALKILRDGYTFFTDAELGMVYVCKPGKLHADYIIHLDAHNLFGKAGCDCPDMSGTGEPCKHYIAAKIDADRQAERAEEVAMCAAYETRRALAGVHDSLLPNDF